MNQPTINTARYLEALSSGIVAAERGVTAPQLKTWKRALDAAGSAAAIAAQSAAAAELAQRRRGNERSKEAVEDLRKASAFFAQWAAKP